MPLLWIVLPLGLAVGSMLAFAIGGIVHANLVDAQKHENGILRFLHLFWIACVAVFAVHGFTLF